MLVLSEFYLNQERERGVVVVMVFSLLLALLKMVV